jgi:hypothetical protein
MAAQFFGEDFAGYLSILPKARTDASVLEAGLIRRNVMEGRLPTEASRVLHGKPIVPFRANG